MIKDIKIITHTDFDGAAFPYIIERICDIYNENGLKYNVSIKYCDINNAGEQIEEDFQNLKKCTREKLNNTFFLVLDIGHIGESDYITDKIKEMQELGLNFSYIDHHKSDNSEKMSKKLECMTYLEHSVMCASMIGYINLLDAFSKVISLNNVEYGKSEYQRKFFQKMFDFKSDNKKVNQFLSDVSNFIEVVDVIDRGLSDGNEKLQIIKDYLNLSTEHSHKDLETILDNIVLLSNSHIDSQCFAHTRSLTEHLREKYHINERINQSLKNVIFIKSNKGEYNLAVFFAPGDIRYDIENKRYDMDKIFEKNCIEPFPVDAVITLTRFTIGHTPIMTIKPTVHKGDVLSVGECLLKDQSKFYGIDSGIPIEYDKETYNKLSRNLLNIAKGDADEIELMKEKIISTLNKYFEFTNIKLYKFYENITKEFEINI